MVDERKFVIRSPVGTFGGLSEGQHFILLPAGTDAPLMRKTGSDRAVLLYNGTTVTRLEQSHKVQRIKT